MSEKAPITQVLLTVNFAPAVPLNVLQIAGIIRHFEADYPLFTQVPRAGPMSFVPNAGQILIGGGALPRIQLVNGDGTRQLMFQDDRITFGWVRVAPLDEPSDYPGFDAVMAEGEEVFGRFRTLIHEATGFGPTPSVAELLYEDGFSPVAPNGQPAPLSSIFRFLQPGEPVPAVNVHYAWTELLQIEGEEGFTQINIGNAVRPDGTQVLIMNSTASFKPVERWEDLASQFQRVRGALNAVFRRVVNLDTQTK